MPRRLPGEESEELPDLLFGELSGELSGEELGELPGKLRRLQLGGLFLRLLGESPGTQPG